jgi:hypothetical protein
MCRSRISIAHIMVAVAFIAVDLFILRRDAIDLSLLVAVPVLEIGLLRVISSRGIVRPYRLGFVVLGWAGVVAFWLGVGSLWYPYIEEQIILALQAIEIRHPDVVRSIATVLWLENTPFKDTLPGLVPFSLVAGLPIFVLALIGGRLAAWRAGRQTTWGSRSCPVVSETA